MSFRVLSAEFAHETNTFSRQKTGPEEFRDRFYLCGSDAIAERGDKNTELAGFLDCARQFEWQLDHILSTSAAPSGKVTNAAFDWIIAPIVEAAANHQYQGILLGLHGAMVTEAHDDGEAELLRRLREVIGHDIPIAVTLDLHANVSQHLCDLANIIVSYKTYPHVDMRDTAVQAGEILHRQMSGEIKAVSIRATCPMLEEVNGGRTDIEPMMSWIESARLREQQDNVFAVSINGGFASSDIPDAGPTVVVTAEGKLDDEYTFANQIIEDIWRHRNQVANEYLEVDAAASIARQFSAESGPLVIADYADNPGAGSYGDSTNLLKALLDAKVSNACFGPMVDTEVAAQLQTRQQGDEVKINLGGKNDPSMGGGPLALTVKLIRVSEGLYTGNGEMIGGLTRSFGPTAVVECEGIEILITSLAEQLLDLNQFRTFGIEPTAKKVVAVKSMQHFRADFDPIAGQIIVCDSGALATPDYRRLKYQKVRRPVFPLDDFRTSVRMSQ